MASGSMYTGYYNNARFYVDWSEGDQDTANNKTLVHWTAGIEAYPGRSSYWYTNAIRINYLYFANSGNLASGTWSNILLDNGSRTPLRSGSLWVTHSTDGTKTLSGSFSGWLTSYGDITTSGNWNLTTIPRNSQVSTDKASYTLGDPIKINTNRLSTSYTHNIIIRGNNSTGTVLKTFNSVGASVTWTPTAAEISTMQQMIPTSNTLTIHIEQHNNQASTESSTTKPLYLKNANPQFSNFTFRDINTSVSTITGSNQVLVKGKSTLEARISFDDRMVAIKDATASNYSISYDGTTRIEPYSSSSNVNATFTPNSIGQRTILATAIDSRNNNTSVSKTVTVYDYEEPTIEPTLTREDSFGTDTTVSLAGDWSPLTIDGVEKNELTTGSLRYRYTENGVPFADNWVTRPFTVDGTRWEMDQDFILSLDNTKKYLFEFEIEDKFGTILATDTVPVGIPVFFIGEVDGNPTAEVGGQSVMVSHVGMVIMSTTLTTDTDVSALYGGTWAIWGTGRVPVGFDSTQAEFDTIEKIGGDKLLQSHTHAIDPPNTNTGNQSANHNHNYTYPSDPITVQAINPADTALGHVPGRGTTTSGANNQSHYHAVNIGSFTSGSSGSGSGQNLQPYITCYMWKRTV